MPTRSTSISRRRLLLGAAATGMLAACSGGTLTPPPSYAQLCTPIPSDLPWLDQVLANSLFASFDKATLVNTVDRSSAVQALQQPYFDRAGQQPVSGSLISQIPSAGVIVTAPGIYTLASDVNWSPNTPYAAAITIAASNVTLNLAGHTITNASPDSTLHVAGILVKGPVENVGVENGMLAAFTEYGVLAAHACGLIVSQVVVTGLRLNDLNARELTPTGIFASYSQDVTIEHCSVTNASVTTDAAAGIQLIRANQADVSDCTTQGLVNNAGGMQGFSYLACENVSTERCTADTFQTFYGNNDLTSGHTCIGFLPTLCFGVQFTDCVASNLTGCCDDAHGISIFVCADAAVTRFHASHILDGVLQGTGFQSGAKATGVEVYSLGSVRVIDSSATDIRARNPQDLQAAGFSAWGAGISFEGCSAARVSVQNDLSVPNMRGIGYGWAPDPRPLFDGIAASGTTYTNCSADTCDVGFDTWYHELATWTGTTTTNCTTAYLAEPLGTLRTLTCNPCSECPVPTYHTNPYVANLINIAFGNTYP